MKRTKVHVAFLLDRSGSMEAVKETTIAGFNQYIETLKGDKNGKYRLTLVSFDSRGMEVLSDNAKIADVSPLTAEVYRPRALTPLYDAIAHIIGVAEKGEHENTIVVIMTDGMENASTKWTMQKVFDLIAEKEKLGWVFVYLGANHDSYAVGGALGIDVGSTMNYAPGQEMRTLHVVGQSTMAFAAAGGGSNSFVLDKDDEDE